MTKLFAVAAFLLASTAAQAQYTFEYGGRTIRIDPDRGTVSIPGVYDNTGRRTKRSHNDQDSDRPRKQAPQQAKTDPQAPPEAAPAQTEPAPAVANTSPEPSTATATAPARVAPTTDTITSTQPSASTPAPRQDAAPAIRPEPAPVVATTAPASAPIQNQAPAPATTAVQSANSPLGMWLTEEKEGKVRIEQCGANLCGYSVDAKSNQNGEKVLINMKPTKDSKWAGRIFDPNTGSTYDSTIALKGSDNLRVQGCAFGGMFCGGQTWSRLN
ncbi:MAG TPA: DUF2147 domain-containing protein [Bradyrhizobium sp.]|nr:DUF2147 domain-containing protein [Bradyrhizobium sp.]